MRYEKEKLKNNVNSKKIAGGTEIIDSDDDAEIDKSNPLSNPMSNKGYDDPGASLMNLMQKLYKDGDDNMKQTIQKSFYEANVKKNQGEI
eukprot:UN10655